MNLARVDAFLAESNDDGEGTLLWSNNCLIMSHMIIVKLISLDAVFHAASNEHIFKRF
jgi:hypothetical protein